MHRIPMSSLALLAVTACSTQQPPAPAPAPQACAEVGEASWYSGARRDRISPDELVAAHKTLPFGTPVQVTSVDTGKSVTVKINDRGPFGKGRVIDLSKNAAEQLGMRRDGVAQVRLEVQGVSGDACLLQEARS